METTPDSSGYRRTFTIDIVTVHSLQQNKLYSHGNYIRELSAAEVVEMKNYKAELAEFMKVGTFSDPSH